jgi:hypothetical protein
LTPANFAENEPPMLKEKFVPSNEAWIVPLPLMPVLSQPSVIEPVNVRSKCPFDWMFPYALRLSGPKVAESGFEDGTVIDQAPWSTTIVIEPLTLMMLRTFRSPLSASRK